jgi:DNA mismatch endonuclease (patch repair protein)
VNAALETLGFRVFRFWEQEIKKELDSCLKLVITHLRAEEGG